MKYKKMNKKGLAALLIWGGAALAAGIGYLVNATKPKATTGSVESIISSMPVWAWIIAGLVLLVLFMRN